MSIPGSANALLLASTAAAAGGYQVSRSLRFNSSDSAYLSRTPAVAGNRRTWTWAGWIKRSAIAFSAEQHIWGVTGATDATYGEMLFGTGDTLRFGVGYNTVYGITTTRVFRDPGAWFHLVLAFDATQGTAANKIKLYINGVEETAFSSDSRSSLANQDWGYNNNVAHYIGRNPNSDIRQFNGYLADIHFIDGQALDATAFTEVSATTGQLIPKTYSGSFGTNGFWLKFSDNSAATAATLGKDYSGNSNNWTPNNLSVTAGAGNDSLVDTPTSYGTDTGVGGEVRGNYCTLNPLDKNTNAALVDGNLTLNGSSAGWYGAKAGFGMSSGKWYFEVTCTSGDTILGIGDSSSGVATPAFPGYKPKSYGYYHNGNKFNNNASSAYGASYGASDVIGIAFDADNGTLTYYKNGTSQGVAFSSIPSDTYFPYVATYNTIHCNFGQRPFAYTAPSGFKALCDTNLGAPVVAKPNTLMDVVLYTGNGSTQTISGLNFSPDLVWIKNRAAVSAHRLLDTIRGATKDLYSNQTDSEQTDANSLTAFTSNGFSVGSSGGVNGNGNGIVAWAWNAGGTTDPSNTAGSITSQVRANASAGFSVVTYTGLGAGNYTVGHGLGVAPSLIICKTRALAIQWVVYHASLGANAFLGLNTTDASISSTGYWGSGVTSTVFGLQSNYAGGNNNGNIVAYCFAPVVGYSSFGSYTGNGSSDGPFVYTGFRPRYLCIKSSSFSDQWLVLDAARNTYNVVNLHLHPNLANNESSLDWLDFTANGFKIRTTYSTANQSSGSFIYFAFAENPFQYARAR